jgi:ATP-dependent exoDNAse (exonuclease V) beta subunit
VTTLLDHETRERIRTSLEETILVEAAAGTGKTTELVRRLINILAEGRGTVQTIAALTFTEKAAGELKLRLRASLEEERRAARVGSTCHANLEEAVAHLEEARISTIHGFCSDLLHERPVEARVDPRFTVLSEAEAERFYAQAFDQWLQEQLEDPPEGLRRALLRPGSGIDGSAVDRLREAGWSLAGWRDLRSAWRRPEVARAARIEALIEHVHLLAAQLGTCSNPDDGLYRDTWRARRLHADLGPRGAAQVMDPNVLEARLVELHGDRYFRQPRRGSDRNYQAGVRRGDVLATHAQLVAELEPFTREVNADLAAPLQQELLQTVERYETLKARAGAVDFLDLLLRTRDLVRDRGDVRAELWRRLTHLFVDEFQDTDPLQAEILLLLASADPATTRWREVTPAPGKLFIVGDPKQSIYRFRRADVSVYQEVKALLEARGAVCLRLTTSFRAVPPIQALVNAAFAPIMTEHRETLQASYVPLSRYREAIPDQPSIVALPVPRPYSRDRVSGVEIERSLPDAVGAFVQWLLAESGWTVTERDRPGERLPLAPRHVCLLFRRFSSWGSDVTRPYVEAFEARKIPHLLVGGKSFHVREEVESLRTALTAVEWPDDALSVYATLKGPLFAVGDEELLEYRQRVGPLHPYRVRGTGEPERLPERLDPVARALALLRELHRLRNRRPVEQTVAALLTATRAHAGFVLRPWGEQALANLLRVTELARSYEVSGGISFRGFVERLRAEAEGEAPEAPIVEEASEGVRIMTVHRAKGLEFPVVVLADITAKIASRRASRHVDAERGLCALPLAGCTPWDLLDHEPDELARDHAEGVRVAYVAATRARDLLVVPAIGDADPERGGTAGGRGGTETGSDASRESWISPVQAALFPPREAWRGSQRAAGCPDFGEDSVLERPDGAAPGPDNIRPGAHSLRSAAGEPYQVVWWDPRRLPLDARPALGIRRQDLIEEPAPEIVAADRARYEAWQAARTHAQAQGGRPSQVVQPVTRWAQRPAIPVDVDGAPTVPVDLVDAAPVVGRSGAAPPRPAGPRFGTLVHAVLATVALDATPEQVAASANLQGRILGAPAGEVAAALSVVATALAHPLMERARDAWRAGRCRRETPIALVGADGTLLEGVLDLAFEDDEGWTVVDFKTETEIGPALPRYRRQLGLYAAVVARATGKIARGVLMRL